MIVASALALPAGLAQADPAQVTTVEVEVEGKVLRQRAKGKSCKIEITVTQAKFGQQEARAVQARLTLRQPCVPGLRKGIRAFGRMNATGVRTNTRTTSRGQEIVEFSAKIHGRLLDDKAASASENLVGEASDTANGRLVGDATAKPTGG